MAGSSQKVIGLAPGTLRFPSAINLSCRPNEMDVEVAVAASSKGSKTVANFMAAVEQRECYRVDRGMD